MQYVLFLFSDRQARHRSHYQLLIEPKEKPASIFYQQKLWFSITERATTTTIRKNKQKKNNKNPLENVLN